MAAGNGPDGTREELALSVPPAADYVGVTRLFGASVARHAGCDEETVEDLKIAISEAVTNAVKAHRAAGITQVVRVVARVGSALTFEIVDAGRGFQVAEGAGAAGEGNFGLALIRSLFGDVAIEGNAGGGTTLRFSVPMPSRMPEPADR